MFASVVVCGVVLAETVAPEAREIVPEFDP
jgi:hypothetical protein